MSAGAGVRSLGYLGLGVRDMPERERFALEILGLQAAVAPDMDAFLRMDKRDVRIALHEDESDDVLYDGWEVVDAAALLVVASRLKAAGIPYERASAKLLHAVRAHGRSDRHDARASYERPDVFILCGNAVRL